MIITKTCNTCEHSPNDHHCVGCEWDKSKGENSKWELKINPIVIERKVLEQIRAEIQHEADNTADVMEMKAFYRCLQIIDKYR